MGDVTGSHKRSRHNSVVDAEKLRSRLDAEQNFHEIQSLIDDNFSEKLSRRKITTSFVDPVVNLNMCILRSRAKSRTHELGAETASELNDIQQNTQVQKLKEEIVKLKQRDAISRSLELKVDLKDKIIADLKRELALARSWAIELEGKNDRLHTQIYMLEVQQGHEGQLATATQDADSSSSAPVVDPSDENKQEI